MAISVNKQGLKKFIDKWSGRGKEDEDDRSYWIDLFQDVFGQSDVTDRIDFQKKVIGPDGNTKRIDAYIPETNIIIEQKSLGIALDKPQTGHNGMTPYEQAKMYDNGLPRSEKARWIVTSNFGEIWIYDMEKRKPEDSVMKVYLQNLAKDYPMLQFLFDPQVEQIRRELKVSQEAGERIGKVYDAMLSLYPGEPTDDDYKSLNLFCVRLVFCYYAEDAGLFGKYQFRDYVASFNPKHLRNGLRDLFRILDTKEEERDRTEEQELLDFPYVNGGLFADHNIIIPQIDNKTQELLTETSDFNWSEISPTIFGAVFESTLNQDTRRKGGMHYTSIENIHKVIDPLFLDDLKEEYKIISESKQPNVRRQKLQDYQKKLGSLKFFDPACGSGNFLTETYLSLRKIENEVIKDLIELDPDKIVNPNQIAILDRGSEDIIKVKLSQFYGIEINDFAVSVAKTALWIAESQMLEETKSIVYHDLSFLPLKSYVNIVEGNALRVNWEEIIPSNMCTYIVGNPPFIGYAYQSDNQKEDLRSLNAHIGSNVDYVCGWYFKAAEYISNSETRCALVSTNSITQGEQIGSFWKPLLEKYNLDIFFAHRTFRWDSESNSKAHVHCVIIGFCCHNPPSVKRVFEDGSEIKGTNITPYLTLGPTVFIERQDKPISSVPSLNIGNMPIDDGNYLFSEDEMNEFLKKEPQAKAYFHPWYDSRGFINRKLRYCLWLGECTPNELRKMPECMKRVEAVKQFRSKSERKATLKIADTPTRFATENIPQSTYIAIPEVSSQRRSYIPMGYLSSEYMCSNKLRITTEATLYHFGVLESLPHMAWMRVVCGRLKSDYDYSIKIVYNAFPWPAPTAEQKSKIEQTAQAILDARALYPDSSLADLYDPIGMAAAPELLKAHKENDKAVIKAYGFSLDMEESEIVAELMKMYDQMIKD